MSADTRSLVLPRMRRRWLMTTLFVVLLLAAGIYLTVGAIAATALTMPVRYAPGTAPSAYGLDYETVQFNPRGDPATTLSGWFVPHPTSARAVIIVHGFGRGGCRTCGLKERLADFGAALQRSGYNILLFDLRGHGHSSDARYTFGLREQYDVLGAVDWLTARGFAPGTIAVFGESMGGAAAVLAAAGEPAIGALVLDSTYADLDSLLQVEFPRRSGLPAFFLPGAYLTGRFIVGEDLQQVRPVEVLPQLAPRPVLLIHGDADELVPFSHLARLTTAYPAAEVWPVAGASHVGSYQVDPRLYVDRVAGFLDQSLVQALTLAPTNLQPVLAIE